MGNYRPITDVWMLARPKVPYYGAYPNGFLERARALLGVSRYDAVLHVCGGHAKQYPAWDKLCPCDATLDLDPATEPDYLGDALDPLPRVDVAPNVWAATVDQLAPRETSAGLSWESPLAV